jgi:TRAP-type C4-dicarboxylate transport system permease small subunit
MFTLLFLALSLYSWIYTVIAIVRSDNIRLVKILLFLLATAVPPIFYLYALRGVLRRIIIHDLKGAPKRLALLKGVTSKAVNWLMEK